MKNTKSIVSAESSPTKEAQVTLSYGDFLQMIMERRLAELEQTHPGQDKRNNNIAGNMTRAVRAFMAVNNLNPQDPVGNELLNSKNWEKARDRLGPKRASAKSLSGKARIWALELIRAQQSLHEAETIGERLARLRKLRGWSVSELAEAVSTGQYRVDYSVLRNWENGRRRPAPKSIATIKRLEEALKVPPGTLVEKMPTVPMHAQSVEAELRPSLKRRVSQHVPADFVHRPPLEQESILTWVAGNILSTPKEILDDGTTATEDSEDVFFFALSREPGRRTKTASPTLLSELDEISDYKTAPIPPLGMRRNRRWAKATQEKADYDLRAFFGALDLLGLPSKAQSVSLFLSPEAIECFISWRHERRGAYTGTLTTLLNTIASFLHPEFGFLPQKPDYGRRLVEIPGFVMRNTAQLAQRDWAAACALAHQSIMERLHQIEKVVVKGRDPFEALLPVINDYEQQPLFVYLRIADEIRSRMPGPEYPIRFAEAQRALLILLIGMTTGLRSKNLRELLVCLPGDTPRGEKELRRRQRGEMHWRDGQWWIRIPREAFKTGGTQSEPRSLMVDDWNEFPIEDFDGHLNSEIDDYLASRGTLLGSHQDPGTFFVKTMASRARSPEYSGNGFYNAFRSMITTYGIYNPYTERGAIEGLKPHGPHSMRHVIATHLVKNFGFDDAAAALFDSPETIRIYYGRYRPGERHRDAMRRAWSGWRQRQGGSV